MCDNFRSYFENLIALPVLVWESAKPAPYFQHFKNGFFEAISNFEDVARPEKK